MKNDILIKYYEAMRYYCILFLFALVPGDLSAQPGWIDYTNHYYYTILNQEGKEISFKKNRKFSITIDGRLFSKQTIPSDSLVPPKRNVTRTFDNHISINDFSFRIPQEARRRDNVEIQIIHKGDTMHFNQPTAKGTYHNAANSKFGKSVLKFLPGYHYFPRWADDFYSNLPKGTGSVQIVNAQQENFLIPRTVYTSINSTSHEDQKEAEDWVGRNFIKSHFNVDRKVEKTIFDRSYLPYKNPRWDEALHPTNNPDIFFGRVIYRFDTIRLSASKSVFSIFNKLKNQVTHWSPKDDIDLFYSKFLYVDNYNKTLYQVVGIRVNMDGCTIYSNDKCPYIEKTFRSLDEGRTWAEDITFQDLHDKYKFRKFEFLDATYALGFTLKERTKITKQTYQQGTYYLLKNFRVIDSLKSPDNVHFNDNYNKYGFSRKGDTATLGIWGYDERNHFGICQKALITKRDSTWTFEVIEENYKWPSADVQIRDTISDYRNFKLLKNRELVFKNGSGTLVLNKDVVGDPYQDGIYVLEKGNHIYLLQNQQPVLLSFDGGLSWYIYPKPLHDRWDYKFLNIDDASEISFFDFWHMEKISYQFHPIK